MKKEVKNKEKRSKPRLLTFFGSNAAMMDLETRTIVAKGSVYDFSAQGCFIIVRGEEYIKIKPQAEVVIFVRLKHPNWYGPSTFRVYGQVKRVNWKRRKKDRRLGYAIHFTSRFTKVECE